MPKYIVRMPVVRVYSVEVEANSREEAIDKARSTDESEYGSTADNEYIEDMDEEMDVTEVTD